MVENNGLSNADSQKTIPAKLNLSVVIGGRHHQVTADLIRGLGVDCIHINPVVVSVIVPFPLSMNLGLGCACRTGVMGIENRKI